MIQSLHVHKLTETTTKTQKKHKQSPWRVLQESQWGLCEMPEIRFGLKQHYVLYKLIFGVILGPSQLLSAVPLS